VEVRAAMARAKNPRACRVCWERRGDGRRQPAGLVMNVAYRQLGGRLAIEALSGEGARAATVWSAGRTGFILELGNVCNLKCRSCHPLFSSRIAADDVHTAWTTQPTPAAEATSRGTCDSHLRTRPSGSRISTPWRTLIASGAGGNAMLSLIGGERSSSTAPGNC